MADEKRDFDVIADVRRMDAGHRFAMQGCALRAGAASPSTGRCACSSRRPTRRSRSRRLLSSRSHDVAEEVGLPFESARDAGTARRLCTRCASYDRRTEGDEFAPSILAASRPSAPSRTSSASAICQRGATKESLLRFGCEQGCSGRSASRIVTSPSVRCLTVRMPPCRRKCARPSA